MKFEVGIGVLVAEMKLVVICFYIICSVLLVSCACEFCVVSALCMFCVVVCGWSSELMFIESVNC
jgi:hypothetical protein